MELRKYIPADHDQIIDLFLLNTPQYFHPQEQKDLEYFLNEDMETDPYFVLEEAGIIWASGGHYFLDGVAGLSWFIVHPDWHGKGLGSRLITHQLDLIRSKHTGKIIVDTSQLVYHFYEKFGFKLVSTTDHHWGPGLHLYKMEL